MLNHQEIKELVSILQQVSEQQPNDLAAAVGPTRARLLSAAVHNVADGLDTTAGEPSDQALTEMVGGILSEMRIRETASQIVKAMR